MIRSERTELLAPAGSYEAFRAGRNAGADAFYLGGERFGARAYADNFNKEILLKTIDEAHLFDKKIYLTINTLFKDNEADELYDYLLPYYEQGLDAVIVQDTGIVKLVKECFPKLPIHASTQMTVTGYEGAALLEKYGLSRVVPARELSIEEIRRIRENTSLEIECFVHGALCYCYSGQCLMSSFIGGRSGNRGRCAQPCRLPYKVYDRGRLISSDKNAYALNTKDICLANDIPELIKAGITSFKIEGRMKRPEYTAGVVSVYRKYLDLYYEGKITEKISREDGNFLEALFNRDGFSKSYYFEHNGRDMMALANSKQSESRIRLANEAYEKVRKEEKPLKLHLTGGFLIDDDLNAIYKISDGNTEAGCSVKTQEALNRPLDCNTVLKQLKKTGGTDYIFDDIKVDIKRDVFMPVAQLNDLRRDVISAFELKKLEETRRKDAVRVIKESKSSFNKKTDAFLSLSVSDKAQYNAVKDIEKIGRIYVPYRIFEEIRLDKQKCSDGRICIALPYISRSEGNAEALKNNIKRLAEQGCRFLVRNLEDAALLIRNGYPEAVIPDHGLYTMNRYSKEFWEEKGIKEDTVPLELDKSEIYKRDNSGSELIIYGRVPLMISAQCVKKNYGKCTGTFGSMVLKDRKNAEFPVLFECDRCYNIIYNSVPLSLLGVFDKIGKTGAASYRLSFTVEDAAEVRNIVNDAIGIIFEGTEAYKEGFAYTRGHFNRGIE